MKSFVVFLVLLIAGFSLASPLKKRIDDLEPSNHRWSLTPDAAGRLHLVDLNPLEVAVEPLFVPADDIILLLFTRQNPTVGQRIFNNNLASIQNSNFNPSHPTRVTIHGWLGSASDAVNIESTAAYLQLGNYNMITVDWNAGAGTVNYITARNRVSEVGRFVATVVDFLHLNNFVQFPNLHVIGHSLGGHAAGFVGKAVTRGRVQVIYGLDPAGPLFYLNSPDDRLTAADGVYVEVMHTNGGTQGFREPIGQAGFFPNYGRSQPGCGLDVAGACAHARTVLLYAESINSVFTGRECQSFEQIDNEQCIPTGRTARMGGAVGNIGLTGNYYLSTNSDAPFTHG